MQRIDAGELRAEQRFQKSQFQSHWSLTQLKWRGLVKHSQYSFETPERPSLRSKYHFLRVRVKP